MPPGLFDSTCLESLVEQGYTLLTPNQRLARSMKRDWDALQIDRGLSVWPRLAVYHIESWLRQQWQDALAGAAVAPRLLLSREQELQVWQQVMREQEAERESPALIHPQAAAELASEARDTLLRWRVDPSAADTVQLFRSETDCRAFHRWLAAFDARLQHQAQCTTADCMGELLDKAATPTDTRVALVECRELAPLELACLDALSASVETVHLPERRAAAVAHPFADERCELQGVAAWAARLHREQPDATLCIVPPPAPEQLVSLEYLLRREFGCLGDDYNSLPVNFSSGIGLASAPVVRDALGLLTLGLEQVAVRDVVAIFQSRFVDLPDADSPLAQLFIRELYNAGSERVGVAALRNFACRVSQSDHEGLAFGERLLHLSGMRDLRGRALPSRWSERFGQVLSEWGWPGSGALDSLEYQQVKLWYQLLDDFRALDAVTGPLDYAGALALLRGSCERQVSHPQTSDSPVQVLGALEAVGLAFDQIWICGMQGGAWPAPARPNPFIPLALQVRHRMPHGTPEREWQFSATLLAQYRAACGTVHGSYSRQRDGVPALPSGLLHAWEEQAWDVAAGPPGRWHEELAGATLETCDDSSAPPPADAELVALRGGAALLERQSQCPFRAFAQHRLRVEPLPEYVTGLSASERGKMVHEALHILWRDIGDHAGLLALSPAECEQVLHRAAEHGRAALPGHRRRALGSGCLELEEERLLGLLRQWLELDRQRGSFRVAELEQAVSLALERLEIRLRVDRIDELPDGARVIIDYKTGKSRLADWLGERPAKPQLLLYGLAASSPPGALAFAQVRPDDCAYIGIGAGAANEIPGVTTDIEKALQGNSEALDWEALNLEWQAVLERLARSFVAGEAAVDPLPKACDWCGLQPLCRVASLPQDAEQVLRR